MAHMHGMDVMLATCSLPETSSGMATNLKVSHRSYLTHQSESHNLKLSASA